MEVVQSTTRAVTRPRKRRQGEKRCRGRGGAGAEEWAISAEKAASDVFKLRLTVKQLSMWYSSVRSVRLRGHMGILDII